MEVEELRSSPTALSEGNRNGSIDRIVPATSVSDKKRKDGRNYVEKNSLSESKLIADREEARTNLKRKAETDAGSGEDLKKDRRAANRLSAFQSRQRRKMIIEDLQKTVAEQSKRNADQAKEIAEIKSQVRVVRQENEILRGQLGASSGVSSAPLLGELGQSLMMAQPQLGMQQQQQQGYQLLQNIMLQNAISTAQVQQGGQFDGINLLKGLGLASGETTEQDQ